MRNGKDKEQQNQEDPLIRRLIKEAEILRGRPASWSK